MNRNQCNLRLINTIYGPVCEPVSGLLERWCAPVAPTARAFFLFIVLSPRWIILCLTKNSTLSLTDEDALSWSYIN